MAVRSSAGTGRYSATGSTESDVVITTTDAWPGSGGAAKPPLIFCHGASTTGLASHVQNQIRRTLEALAEHFVIILPDLAGDSFGNDTGLARMNDALAYLRSSWNATNDPPWIVGGSMGGCVALNYAKDYPVAGVAAVIPMVDMGLAYSTLGVYGIPALIDAAYGGTYDPVTEGPDNDPILFASSLSSSIPIRLFPTVDDPLLPYSTATAFQAARPSTTVQNLGTGGHDGAVFAVADDYLVPWVLDTSTPVAPSPAGANLVPNGTFETNTAGWTAYLTTISRDTTEHRTGVASLKIICTGASQGTYAGYFPTQPGRPYTATAWVKGTGAFRAGLFYSSNWVSTGPFVTLTSTWQQISITYTPTAGQTGLLFFPYSEGAATVYMDDVEFRYAGGE